MSLTEQQKKMMDTYLAVGRLSAGEESRVTLRLSRREVRFLIEAVDHFLETRCPTFAEGDECAMLSWEEDVHSGALERVCVERCEMLIDRLLAEAAGAGSPNGR